MEIERLELNISIINQLANRCSEMRKILIEIEAFQKIINAGDTSKMSKKEKILRNNQKSYIYSLKSKLFDLELNYDDLIDLLK